MLVYRISKAQYKNDLTGTGAAMYGGRWNPKGIHMVYTAGNIALAYVEFLVHNYHLLTSVDVSLACIEIPADTSQLISEVHTDELSEGWQEEPRFLSVTRQKGKQFIQDGVSYLLKVPSAIVPGEFNYLLNPYHPEHKNTRVSYNLEPLTFDKRLFQQ